MAPGLGLLHVNDSFTIKSALKRKKKKKPTNIIEEYQVPASRASVNKTPLRNVMI